MPHRTPGAPLWSRCLLAAILLGGAALVSTSGSGCASKAEGGEAGAAETGTTDSIEEAPEKDAPVLPPGAKGGKPTGVPDSCASPNTYLPVSASDCMFVACTGSVAYALCVGGTFSACDCGIPVGYTEVMSH